MRDAKHTRSVPAVSLAFAALAVGLLAAGPALAKPRPSGTSPNRKTSGQKRSGRGAARTHFASHSLAVGFVANAPLHAAEGSYGVALEYHFGLTSRWRLQVSSQLRFVPSLYLVQPHISAEVDLARADAVRVHAGFGVSAPIVLAPADTAVAVAGRVHAGVGWSPDWSSFLEPYGQAVAAFGPVLTPNILAYELHAALQIILGTRFNF